MRVPTHVTRETRERLNVAEGWTREEWLREATRELFVLLKEKWRVDPVEVRVSVGLPSVRATSVKNRAIGQCWPPSKTADGVSQVFISPVLVDPIEVLATLLHELVHALTPGEGHKGEFRKLAFTVGLRGRMTETVPSDELRFKLEALAQELGVYPHARLMVEAREKQTTRMHKIVCPECGYTARVTELWLEKSLPYHMECECFFMRVTEPVGR